MISFTKSSILTKLSLPLSRFLNVSAEVAMQKSNRKFYRRFTAMEKLIEDDNKEIDKLPLEELENLDDN